MDDNCYFGRGESWRHRIDLCQRIPVQTDWGCIRNSDSIVCNVRRYRHTLPCFRTSQHNNGPCHPIPTDAHSDRHEATEEAEMSFELPTFKKPLQAVLPPFRATATEPEPT